MKVAGATLAVGTMAPKLVLGVAHAAVPTLTAYLFRLPGFGVTGGRTLTGVQTWVVAVEPADVVSRVSFEIDGEVEGVSRTAPHVFEYDTAALTEGRHTITARLSRNDRGPATTLSNDFRAANASVVPVDLAGDGTDQTTAIQRAIDRAPDGTAAAPTILRLPDGRFRKDGTVALTGRHHVELLGPSEGTCTFYTDRKIVERRHFRIGGTVHTTGCWIRGVRIEGENDERRSGTPSYAGFNETYFNAHAFEISALAVDCGLEDCYAQDVYGDGIYIGDVWENGVQVPQNVVVRRCEILRAGRQGIAITAAENVHIRDVKASKIGRSGMDIEPNHRLDRVRNVTFENCRVEGAIGDWKIGGHSDDPTALQPRVSDIRMTNCVALPRIDPTKGGVVTNVAPFWIHAESIGGLVHIDRFTSTVATGPDGSIRIVGSPGLNDDPPERPVVADHVIIENSRLRSARAAGWQEHPGQDTIGVTVGAHAAIGSLTIRNNVFDGIDNGHEFLYRIHPGGHVGVLIHHGNEWEMGTLDDHHLTPR